MKRLKKLISALLATVMVVSLLSVASFASPAQIDDPYAANTIESVTIDGVITTFRQYYDARGNRCIDVHEMGSATTDTVCYIEKADTIYLNNDILATVAIDSETIHVSSNNLAATGWEPVKTYNRTVTWAQSTTVSLVAAAIAAVLTYAGPVGVIGSVTAGVLSNIARACAGARLSGSSYIMRSGTSITYKDVFKLYPKSGGTYGPYTVYIGG